jgi:hypothetical protein
MKIHLSYLKIDVKFIDMDAYGEFHPPDLIYIQSGLTGPLLVDTLNHEINHEINHVGYYLYAPSEEESQVRVCSSLWTEALCRNKSLKQLVENNL